MNFFPRSKAGMVGSNPTQGMDVCMCVYSVFVQSCVQVLSMRMCLSRWIVFCLVVCCAACLKVLPMRMCLSWWVVFCLVVCCTVQQQHNTQQANSTSISSISNSTFSSNASEGCVWFSRCPLLGFSTSECCAHPSNMSTVSAMTFPRLSLHSRLLGLNSFHILLVFW
jgi:hypothetical protein